MCELMASRLNSPILHFPSNFGIELPHRLVVVSEVWVVARVALDADSPALLGHAEDEGPAVLGVQVGVG